MIFGSGIKKPYGHPGGKKLLSKIIVSMLPTDYEDMIYVEPFFGGGSVFFSKEPSTKEIINDLDKNIYILMKGFKKYDGNEISKIINKRLTEDEFYQIRDAKPKTEFNKFIRLLLLKKNSFNVNMM